MLCPERVEGGLAIRFIPKKPKQYDGQRNRQQRDYQADDEAGGVYGVENGGDNHFFFLNFRHSIPIFSVGHSGF
jgi:hypothetical protein